jgi:hypothetical protein
MRIFKTKWFTKWALKEDLKDNILLEAIKEMEQGLIDANLGSNVFKKRIAKEGHGKSGSTRTIIAFKINNKAFFMFGFAKNQKDNINQKELKALKDYASILLNLTNEEIKKAIEDNEFTEVLYE